MSLLLGEEINNIFQGRHVNSSRIAVQTEIIDQVDLNSKDTTPITRPTVLITQPVTQSTTSPTHPPTKPVTNPYENARGIRRLVVQRKTYSIDVPYLTGSAFEKLDRSTIWGSSPYYSEKELAKFISILNESSIATKTQEKPAEMKFKPSVFDWENALIPLRGKVCEHFYKLEKRSDKFYKTTSDFIDESMERDKKQLNNAFLSEHYWYNEENKNLRIMDKLMGYEFTPYTDQEYIYNLRFIQKMLRHSDKFFNRMVIDLDKPVIGPALASSTFERITKAILDRYDYKKVVYYSGTTKGVSPFVKFDSNSRNSTMLGIKPTLVSINLKELFKYIYTHNLDNIHVIILDRFHFTKKDFAFFSRMFRIGALNSPVIWFINCKFDLGRIDLINWYDLKHFHTNLIFQECQMDTVLKNSWKRFRNIHDVLTLFYKTNIRSSDVVDEEAMIENQ